MSDLIYRQVAIDTLIRAQEPVNNGDGTITIRLFNEGAIREAMKNIPTVDAVPVVRCGECKHMMADGRCFEFADDCLRPSASDFCSKGERRTDGTVD